MPIFEVDVEISGTVKYRIAAVDKYDAEDRIVMGEGSIVSTDYDSQSINNIEQIG